MRHILVVSALLFAAACAGPAAAPVPTTPAPIDVPGPAPVARLRVGSTDPVLMVASRPLVFDASESSGDGLSYHVEYGDGHATTSATSTYASQSDQVNQTATVTVTDRFGRSATTTVKYAVVSMHTPLSWVNNVRTGAAPSRSLTLRQNGDSVSGSFNMSGGAFFCRVSGKLAGERELSLVCDAGNVRLEGSVEWRQQNVPSAQASYAVLRMRVVGGAEDGMTFDFVYSDPY